MFVVVEFSILVCVFGGVIHVFLLRANSIPAQSRPAVIWA